MIAHITVLLDSLIPHGWSYAVRLSVWAAGCGLVSMGLYAWLAPRQRIAESKKAAAAARHELDRYDGDANGLMRVAGRAVATALKHMGLTIGPALAAALPVITAYSQLQPLYQYRALQPGETVTIAVVPETEAIAFNDTTVRSVAKGMYELTVPRDMPAVTLSDSNGTVLMIMRAGDTPFRLGHRRWWHRLIGGTDDYLPSATPLRNVQVVSPVRQYLSWGPEWLRDWHFPFFAVIGVVSLAIKLVFKLE